MSGTTPSTRTDWLTRSGGWLLRVLRGEDDSPPRQERVLPDLPRSRREIVVALRASMKAVPNSAVVFRQLYFVGMCLAQKQEAKIARMPSEHLLEAVKQIETIGQEQGHLTNSPLGALRDYLVDIIDHLDARRYPTPDRASRAVSTDTDTSALEVSEVPLEQAMREFDELWLRLHAAEAPAFAPTRPSDFEAPATPPGSQAQPR